MVFDNRVYGGSIDIGISHMIYTNVEYKVKFYKELENNTSPVLGYVESLPIKEKTKIVKYIEFLRINKGVLDEPYTKHIKGKIRELRVDFSSKRHRIFYFTFVGKNIILLHAFTKKTEKTPLSEIKKAEEYYYNVLNNQKVYG